MQANKFRIPRLGFINKLDRPGSSIQTTVESIKRRLKVEPLLVNIPSSESTMLKGIIDLPSMHHFEYLDEKGKLVNIEKIDKDNQFYARAIEHRSNLIEALANYDETLADLYLSGTPVE
jgi:elongation factor G